jgi:hypothetical protein
LIFQLELRLLCGDKLPLFLHKFEQPIGLDPASSSHSQLMPTLEMLIRFT